MKRFLLALLLCIICAGTFAGGGRAQTVVPATTPAPAPTGISAPTAQAPAQAPTPAPTAFLTPTPVPTTQPISAAGYRALLQTAIDKIKVVQKRPTANLSAILKPLDGRFSVKRADGRVQTVDGDEWNRLLSGVAGPYVAKLSRAQTRDVRGSLEKRVQSLDDWTTPRAGGYYAAFDAQKVVSDAVAQGQIRVGPPPAQQFVGNTTSAIGKAIDNFFKWLGGLFPRPSTPSPSFTAPDLSWLWFVFWAIMLSLLGLLLFLAARALSGGSFSLWGWGKRRKKSEVELRDEDAALFQLAPEELRDRADIFASQGNFREALRHRFISLLVLLDARGTWRYDIRRTNWEHIAALRRDETKRPLVAPLSDLTRAFDRVRYGDAPCDEDGWNSFQSGVRQIEAQVGGRAVAR